MGLNRLSSCQFLEQRAVDATFPSLVEPGASGAEMGKDWCSDRLVPRDLGSVTNAVSWDGGHNP